MFSKRPSELNPEDVEHLESSAAPEGLHLEFKRGLSVKKGEDDRWMTEGKITEKARNAVIKELIAFANAHGGTLVLGIDETNDNPPRASSICPIPKCRDLAERLIDVCRTCIEPQIPILYIVGVPMSGDAGVVVAEVPQSRSAPHRSIPELECYIRRANRTDRMTMTEIQDLTLFVERGLTRIEARFQARALLFHKAFATFAQSGARKYGIRATLVPLMDIYLRDVYGNEAVTPPMHELPFELDGRSDKLSVPARGYDTRPILRGMQISSSSQFGGIVREVYCDGLIEYTLLLDISLGEDGRGFYPSWMLALIGNSLIACERFRSACGSPGVEYGLEVEVLVLTAEDIPVYSYLDRYMDKPPLNSIQFHRLSVKERETFASLMIDLNRDFWHALGKSPRGTIHVDFRNVL